MRTGTANDRRRKTTSRARSDTPVFPTEGPALLPPPVLRGRVGVGGFTAGPEERRPPPYPPPEYRERGKERHGLPRAIRVRSSGPCVVGLGANSCRRAAIDPASAICRPPGLHRSSPRRSIGAFGRPECRKAIRASPRIAPTPAAFGSSVAG